MRAIVGDVIGTKDGRYGTVSEIDPVNGMLTVLEAVDPDDEHPQSLDDINVFFIQPSSVASIV